MGLLKNVFKGYLDNIFFNRIISKNNTLSEMPYGETPVQAVDIDWNDAQVQALDENGKPIYNEDGTAYFKTITTTGNLLEYIQKGTVTGMSHVLLKISETNSKYNELNNLLIEYQKGQISEEGIQAAIEDFLKNNPNEIVSKNDLDEVSDLITNLQSTFGTTNTEINNSIAELESRIDGLEGLSGEINDINNSIKALASTDYVVEQVQQALDAITTAGNTLTEAQEDLVIDAINNLLGRYDLNDDGTISSDEDGGAGLQGLLEQLLEKINKNTEDIETVSDEVDSAKDYTDTQTTNLNNILTGKINKCVQITDEDWERLKSGSWVTQNELAAYAKITDIPTLPASFIDEEFVTDKIDDALNNIPKPIQDSKLYVQLFKGESQTPFYSKFINNGSTVAITQDILTDFTTNTTFGYVDNNICPTFSNLVFGLDNTIVCRVYGAKYTRAVTYKDEYNIDGTFSIERADGTGTTQTINKPSDKTYCEFNVSTYCENDSTYNLVFTPTNTEYKETSITIVLKPIENLSNIETTLTNIINSIKVYQDNGGANDTLITDSQFTIRRISTKSIVCVIKFKNEGTYYFKFNEDDEDELFSLTIKKEQTYNPNPSPSPSGTTASPGGGTGAGSE